jgi:hypothetical protein
MAGTGKSTIARTVARIFKEAQSLGASFFFSRGKEDLSDANAFFATLAAQLTETLPDLKYEVCDAISKNNDIAQQPLPRQWKELILLPLLKLDKSLLEPFTLVLVIDALDECEGEGYRHTIVQLLTEVKNLQMVRVRVFITSRLENSINRSFSELPEIIHFDLMLHCVPESDIESDISTFLKREFAEIGKARAYAIDWPGEETIRKLVQRADRLFIYAATICRFLRQSKFPKRRLDEMLKANSTTQLQAKELDQMYILILKTLINEDQNDNDEVARSFKLIIGSIVAAFDVLSTPALTTLLSVEADEMKVILDPLHSVLSIPEDKSSPIQLFHHSFREFLFEKDRCSDERFQVDEIKAHTALADACIRTMSKLKQDICGLNWPGTLTTEVKADRIQQCFPPELQYACRYWIEHLQKSDMPLVDNGQVHEFLCKHLLYWLEALSLMRKTHEGALAVITLDSLVAVSETLTNLLSFLLTCH